MEQSCRGFTLIEVLVSISIISMLASIVLTSIGRSRALAYDASVKGTMRNVLSRIEYLNIPTPSTYATACLDPEVVDALDRIDGICNGNSVGWTIYAPLKVPEPDSTGWCYDSSGKIFRHSSGVVGILCNIVVSPMQ